MGRPDFQEGSASGALALGSARAAEVRPQTSRGGGWGAGARKPSQAVEERSRLVGLAAAVSRKVRPSVLEGRPNGVGIGLAPQSEPAREP
jgi:hypothetical protein